MKTIFLAALGLLIFLNWERIVNYGDPPPDYAAAHGGKVILYSTAWCGYCEKARQLMNSNNIEYVEYDIEKSSEGHDQYKRLGGRGIPVLLIKGEVIKGYDERRILTLTGKGDSKS